MALTNKYIFSKKAQSRDGLISLIIGCISLFFIVGVLGCSIYMKGTVPEICAIIFYICGLISFFGLCIAIMSYKNEKTYKKFKNIGLAVNLVAIMIVVIILLLGFLL